MAALLDAVPIPSLQQPAIVLLRPALAGSFSAIAVKAVPTAPVAAAAAAPAAAPAVPGTGVVLPRLCGCAAVRVTLLVPGTYACGCGFLFAEGTLVRRECLLCVPVLSRR